MGNKSDCSNFCSISLFQTAYKIVTNILLLWLTTHIDKITGNHLCGFLSDRYNTYHIFCIIRYLG